MAFSIEEFPFSKEYDSDLRAVLETVREVMKTVKTYDDTIADLQTALNNISGLYTRVSALESATSDLGTIRTNISNIQTTINSMQIKHNRDIADVKNIITNNVNLLQKQIDYLNTYTKRLNNDITRLRVYMDSRYNVMEATIAKNQADIMYWVGQMETKLNKTIEDMKQQIDSIDTSAINPWHTLEGKINLAKNLDHIYNELADEVLTASEYVKLGLDAEGYSLLDINARGYAEFGKELTHFYWKYAPASGYRQDINNVLTDAITFIERTMTADEYTALDIDADAYALIELTADDYYRYGKQSLNSWIDGKQKRLVAGENITIADNEDGDPVISAAGIKPFRVDFVDGVMVFSYTKFDFIVDMWIEDGIIVFSKIPRELV